MSTYTYVHKNTYIYLYKNIANTHYIVDLATNECSKSKSANRLNEFTLQERAKNAISDLIFFYYYFYYYYYILELFLPLVFRLICFLSRH